MARDAPKLAAKKKRKDSDEPNLGLKDRSLALLRMVIRRRATDFFEAEVDIEAKFTGTAYGELKKLLTRAEALV